jgi:hypothetical protein
MWCVANQDTDHPFAMHQELIQQTHDIEGSLDFHVFGGANNNAAAPTEGRVVHVHHDMVWLNDAQFQGLKYVAKHYFIHPRPGHPLAAAGPAMVETGPTEEELINYIAPLPTFEKATVEHFMLNHDSSCVCDVCKPVVVMSGVVEESVEESVKESVEEQSVEAELTVDDAHVEVVEVVLKKGKKRHFVDEN